MSAPIRTAVIPVGGLGARFLPATRATPKEMLPVLDKPLIQYVVEEARAAGAERIVLVTARGKTAVVDHFDRAPALEAELEATGRANAAAALRDATPPAGSIVAVRQQRPLGLGHAVWCAREALGDEPFAVLLPDDFILAPRPCLAQMAEAYAEAGGALVAAMPVARKQAERYGILDPGPRGGASDGDALVPVAGLVEKPRAESAPSNLAVIGRYILPPAIVGLLARHRRGAGGEIQLTDAIAALVGTVPVHGYRFAGERFDCGTALGLLEASIAVALARPELADGARAMLARATAR